MSHRRRWVTLVVTLAVATAAIGGLVVLSRGSGDPDEAAMTDAPNRAPDLKSMLTLFRSSPSGHASLKRGGKPRPFWSSGPPNARVELHREKDSVCIGVTLQPGGSAGGCTDRRRLWRGGITVITWSDRHRHGLGGIAIDGISRLNLVEPAREATVIPVRKNTFFADMTGMRAPAEIRWRDFRGDHHMRVPLPYGSRPRLTTQGGSP